MGLEGFPIANNETTAENPQIKALRDQIEQMTKANMDAVKKKDELLAEIDQMKAEKGYAPKTEELQRNTEGGLESIARDIFPDKTKGLSNLNTMMEALNTQEQNGGIEKKKRMLADLIREASSSDDVVYVQHLITDTYSTLMPDDKYLSDVFKAKRSLQEQKDADPELIALTNDAREQDRIIEENSSYKIEDLQKQIEEIERKTL